MFNWSTLPRLFLCFFTCEDWRVLQICCHLSVVVVVALQTPPPGPHLPLQPCHSASGSPLDAANKHNIISQETWPPSTTTTYHYPGVIASLCPAHHLDPNYPGVIASLCPAHHLASNYPGVIVSLCTAHYLAPNYPGVIVSLCPAHHLAPNYPGVIVSLCPAHHLAPNYPGVIVSLCTAHHLAPNYPGVIVSLYMAHHPAPNYPGVIVSLCPAHHLAPNYPDVIASLCPAHHPETVMFGMYHAWDNDVGYLHHSVDWVIFGTYFLRRDVWYLPWLRQWCLVLTMPEIVMFGTYHDWDNDVWYLLCLRQWCLVLTMTESDVWHLPCLR